uniref:Uncharacterized protein n=1 Tax=Octopus bimaculoides TaxID=37653 RepID=A0A0L8FXR7_OCTBM
MEILSNFKSFNFWPLLPPISFHFPNPYLFLSLYIQHFSPPTNTTYAYSSLSIPHFPTFDLVESQLFLRLCALSSPPIPIYISW